MQRILVSFTVCVGSECAEIFPN